MCGLRRVSTFEVAQPQKSVRPVDYAAWSILPARRTPWGDGHARHSSAQSLGLSLTCFVLLETMKREPN